MARAPLVAIMMATLGMMILINAVCLMIWGPISVPIPLCFPTGALDMFGIFITYNYIAAGILSIGLSLGFLAFYRFTNLGLMQRCTANNTKAALAIGIHTAIKTVLPGRCLPLWPDWGAPCLPP